MKSYSIITISCMISLISLTKAERPADGYTPIFITELWRHGARAAAFDTFNQSYMKEVGPGNIQGNGMRMHFNLGQKIRSEYNDTIFNTNKWSDYEIYSTSYQRTILSAYSHVMGLYPPGTGQKTNNTEPKTKLTNYKGITDVYPNKDTALPFGVRGIPVVTYQKKNDDFFMKGMGYKCKKADDLKDKTFEEMVKKKPDVFKKVEPILEKAKPVATFFPGQKKYNLNTSGIFSDLNKCFYFATGKAMSGTEDIFPKMKYIFGIYYINSKYVNLKIRKLYTTNMSKKILEYMRAAINRDKNPTDKAAQKFKLKYFGLSGHEANVVPFMLQYKLTSEACLIKKLNDEKVEGTCLGSPEFGASIIWELSKKGTEYFVRFNYEGEPYPACEKPNDQKYCSFADFEAFMKKELILSDSDYAAFCPAVGGGGSGKVVFIVIILVLLLVVGAMGFLLMKTKNEGSGLEVEMNSDIAKD